MRAELKDGTFDEAARERLRGTLRRYMSDHKIGVPTLLDRIEKADDLEREMPLSTLQRFLRGTHRTSDFYVAMCAGFLKKMDAPPAAEDFGEAFASFLGAPDGHPAEAATMTVENMAGVYKTFASRPDAETPLPLRSKDARGSSSITLRALPGQPFLAAEEDFSAPRDSRDRRRFAYDGVALVRGDVLYAFLRSSLTRRPKTYSVQPRTQGPRVDAFILEGEGFEHPASQGLYSHCKTQFVSQSETEWNFNVRT